jgi:beta-lactamase class D
MKNLFFIFFFLVSSCATQKEFPDKEVCFLLFDLKKNEFVEKYNENHCKERLPAASTFKIPLAVMAYDAGLFTNESSPVYKWNGVVSSITPWNKDHNPTSWIRESVVWMSQVMTAQLGMKKIQNYLESFNYGNQDMTGGLKYAWLTPAPFITEPMKNSLKISAFEQVTFLIKLWRQELNVSKRAQVMTQKIMNHDKSHRGSLMVGKTGSGFFDENYDSRVGWFVGHLSNDKSQYIVVVNFTDKQKVAAGTFGGEAKEMTFKLLSEKGLW